MVSAHDVAAYILRKQDAMSTWKLQKLVYYCQAWHLVWDDELLFEDRIEAWANGPVVWSLYDKHRGRFSVSDWEWGDPEQLNPSEQLTIDIVLKSYGHLPGRQLSHLTHDEGPWKEARQGLASTVRSNRPISWESMQEYYTALDIDESAQRVEDIDWESIGS